jgi:hypothetical protein
VYLIYARDAFSSDWHRIDADVRPVQRSALCGHAPIVQSEQEAPWCETWRNRMLAPPGTFCAKCDDIAKRLTRPIESTPPVSTATLDPKEVLLTLGDDFAKLLEDL